MAPQPMPEDSVHHHGAAAAFDFNEWLHAQVMNTPWWILSVALHAIILAGASLMYTERLVAVDTPPITVVISPPKNIKKLEFDRPRDVVERRGLPQDDAPNDQVTTNEPAIFNPNAEDSDHNESNDGEDYGQMKGDSTDFLGFVHGDSGGIGRQAGAAAGIHDTMGVGYGGGGGGRYGGRLGGNKDRRVKAGGGTTRTESAVLAGLKWLARHQNADGSWSAATFSANCKKSICPGEGSNYNDTGVTGLSLLAFLGAGYTHLSRDTYHDPYLDKDICLGDVVKGGIRWLIKSQDSDGCFGGQSGGKYMYNHSVGALAMAEAYGLTESLLFKDPAQKGIDFILMAQNPYKGWRYTKKCGDNDTSVVGWCVMALKSAKLSNLAVSQDGFSGAKAWIVEVTDEAYFKAGYTARGTGHVVTPENEKYAPHEALTAVAMMCRMFIDHDRTDPALEGGAKVLVDDLPTWDPTALKIDYYYWYYGTLALYQYDGPTGQYWSAWNKAMIAAIVPNQKTAKDDCADGSWESDTKAGFGRWAFEGGRVYVTAINTLTLEIYYRYDSAFGGNARGGDKKKPDEKKPDEKKPAEKK